MIERTEFAVSSPLVLLIWEDRLRVLAAIPKSDPQYRRDLDPGPCVRSFPRHPDMTGALEAMVPAIGWTFIQSMLPKPIPKSSRRRFSGRSAMSRCQALQSSRAGARSRSAGRGRPATARGSGPVSWRRMSTSLPPQVHREIAAASLCRRRGGHMPQPEPAQLAQKFERGLMENRAELAHLAAPL